MISKMSKYIMTFVVISVVVGLCGCIGSSDLPNQDSIKKEGEENAYLSGAIDVDYDEVIYSRDLCWEWYTSGGKSIIGGFRIDSDVNKKWPVAIKISFSHWLLPEHLNYIGIIKASDISKWRRGEEVKYYYYNKNVPLDSTGDISFTLEIPPGEYVIVCDVEELTNAYDYIDLYDSKPIVVKPKQMIYLKGFQVDLFEGIGRMGVAGNPHGIAIGCLEPSSASLVLNVKPRDVINSFGDLKPLKVLIMRSEEFEVYKEGGTAYGFSWEIRRPDEITCVGDTCFADGWLPGLEKEFEFKLFNKEFVLIFDNRESSISKTIEFNIKLKCKSYYKVSTCVDWAR